MRPERLLPLLLLPAGPSASLQAQEPLVPRAGMVVTESTRFAPGSYRLPAPDHRDSALIVVRGDDIVLDLSGVVLEGTFDGMFDGHYSRTSDTINGIAPASAWGPHCNLGRSK